MLQDVIALSIVFFVSGSFVYKRYFAKNKLKTCGKCANCPSHESKTPSSSSCPPSVILTRSF